MRFTHFFFLLNFFVLLNCKQESIHLLKIEATQIQITDTLKTDSEIEAYIKPFRTHIQKDLDTVLAYSVYTFSKKDGNLNTAIGNFIADAVYSETNPVFNSKTGKNIDMVLLNYGSIRAPLKKGAISKKNAFQLMPFENSIVVVALSGMQIYDLIHYLRKAKRPHPISKLKLKLDNNFNVIDAKVNGKEILANKTYYVATSDYLLDGGDHMIFFKPNKGVYFLNYKIRNVLIDAFSKIDSIKPSIDDRFIQIK